MGEDREQEEGDVDLSGAYTNPMDRFGSSIVTLTDPKSALYNFELSLRNLRKNASGRLIKTGEPLLNEEGINAMLGSVESVVHHMNALSNFNEISIEYLHNTLRENIIGGLMFNRIKWKVDRKNRDMIVGNAIRFSYGFMMRAFSEGERKFWKGSVTEVKHTQEINKGKTGGINFNPFSSWGKK